MPNFYPRTAQQTPPPANPWLPLLSYLHNPLSA